MKIKGSLCQIQASYKYALILVVILLTASLSLGCLSDKETSEPFDASPAIAATQSQRTATHTAALFDEQVVTALYERSIPAVVEVNTVTKQNSFQGLTLPTQRGQGSGFIIDNAGHILTNYHVIDGASEVSVSLHDGRTLDAEILGTDREDDLALIQVDAEALQDITPLPLGDSEAVKPGQMAIALGSPLGLEGSITVGVISGKGRSLTGAASRPITDILQTDASITFGNSGGPLLNSSGEVVGINTAIQVSASGASGIGYAVPINTAKSVLSQLVEGTSVRRPWLGIEGTAISRELVEELDLPVESGVYVVSVMPDSPAEEAGLRGSGTDRYGNTTFGGDIITAVEGTPVAMVEELVKYFNTHQPGDTVDLSVTREKKSITVEVTLGEWPEEFGTTETQTLPFPEEFDFEWQLPEIK